MTTERLNILALDLAGNVGWARSFNGDLTYGSVPLPKSFENVGRFMAVYEDWLALMLKGMDYAVYEAPFVGDKTTPDVAMKLFGLAATTEKAVYIANENGAGIRVRSARIDQVRKHFLGSARGTRDELKAKTIRRCQELGLKPLDDDTADAIAVHSYATKLFSDAREARAQFLRETTDA